MAELILNNVYKKFGDNTVVNDLNLRIPSGAFTALLGPSGCGKTTTLRMLAGLEKLSSGRLMLGSRVLADSTLHTPSEDRNMSMVFQSYALWPHMTVAENVGYPLKIQKVQREALNKQVNHALDVVGLGQYAQRTPQELSGGQRQRVALARCLVSSPKVVLLDEPLANLDRHLRASMEETFREFHRRTGATFVYVTHDQEEAMALATHIAVMHNGELMQWGEPNELYHQPKNAWVASFIGQGSILELALGEVPSSVTHDVLHKGWNAQNNNGTQNVLIRPQHVKIGADGIDAIVESAVYQGERYLVKLSLPNGQSLEAYHSLSLKPQERVSVVLEQGWVL